MSSCSSSIQPQKSAKSDKSHDQRSKSCDTVCTSDSSCILQRRKPQNPLMYSIRANYSRSTPSTAVRQRVLSAKLLKLRSIQSQLNDANYHLAELTKENQILKNLQKRQDKALSKYENTSADLPRLLHSHEEQLRVLTEKNKTQKKTIKELNDQLKLKDDEFNRMQERLMHLEKLNRDKRLLEREKMAEIIEDLKIKCEKAEDMIIVLNRKLMLESKTSKQRLNSEVMKHKDTEKELIRALSEVERLTALLETKENSVQPRKNRFSHINPKQSISMVTLAAYQSNRTRSKDRLSTIEDSEPQTPVTDVKLEPIKYKREANSKKSNGFLSMPSENIRNRLSSGSAKSRASQESSSGVNELKGVSSGSEVSLNSNENLTECNIEDEKKPVDKNRPSSAERLDKMSDSLDTAMQKAQQSANDEFDKKLGSYCADIITNVRQCSERIQLHKKSLTMSKEDTDVLLESFTKTQKMEAKLQNSFLDINGSDNVDFIKELFNDEVSFETILHKDKGKDKNGNIMKNEPHVKMKDKKKLLATLKAIDNGESFDSLEEKSTEGHDSHLLKEIYNDLAQ
ncbi:unnamed protein product [Acanthoscelides obtectus]|uniref:Lebercilin domain-containing protein n=1 Tax=Acanthoscelides obtectus TaxID=200917 RepID=A0A9P0KM66_ACAOB|nr:unnamed protein product [Acanthoscelides obtectus]CAK1660715.1 Lebercilin-like protein [Acanthoscelides obtectus]